MDADRFDALSHALTRPGSRRTTLGALGGAFSHRRLAGVLSGSGLGAALGLLRRPASVSAGCGGKCGPCKRCKRGRCKANKKLNDTSCNGDGRCLDGRCKPRPVCTAAGQACSVDIPELCCSGVCRPAQPTTCTRGNNGARCYSGSDCISGQCVGYRCQGNVDCTTAPEHTICHVHGGCVMGTCSPCWNADSSTCCKVAYEATLCLSPSQCQQGQCT
jgi:hypothetical protein